jgi:hypothetical protein
MYARDGERLGRFALQPRLRRHPWMSFSDVTVASQVAESVSCVEVAWAPSTR